MPNNATDTFMCVHYRVLAVSYKDSKQIFENIRDVVELCGNTRPRVKHLRIFEMFSNCVEILENSPSQQMLHICFNFNSPECYKALPACYKPNVTHVANVTYVSVLV